MVAIRTTVMLMFLNMPLFVVAAAAIGPLAQTYEEQQKELLEVINIEKVPLSKQAKSSIPYIGIRPYYVPHQYLSNSYEKVLVLNKKAIGAVAFYYWVCQCDSMATIVSVGINNEYQKKGHGTYLMNCVLEEIKSHGTETIILKPVNGSASFFKKFGFKPSGESGYMRLKLNSSPTSSPPSSPEQAPYF